MSYSPIYQFTFDSLKGDTYTGYIDKLNYTGPISNVRCAGDPVRQQWQQDEAAPSVKGCMMTVTLINEGALPITSFFSVNDTDFRIRYYWGSQLLFTGYLVQDDSSEEQIDIKHDITLNFSDGLGLLKDIDFNEANRLVGSKTEFIGDFSVSSGLYIVLYNTITSGAQIGDNMKVVSGTLADGVYRIVNIVITGPHTFIYVAEELLFNVSPGTIGTFTFIESADLTDRLPLTTFIKICLQNTGLELNCNVYNNLVVTGGATGRMLEDVYLDGEMFLSGEQWQSCYQVLNFILTRYFCTLFQSYGVWNIARMSELRYYDNDIPSIGYDYNMVQVDNAGVIQLFNYGGGTDIETGLLGTPQRAWSFDKETFNYKQPTNLLRNSNLQNLGALISEYVNGSETWKEYVFEDWFVGDMVSTPHSDRFIRVIYDTATMTEKARYAVNKNISGIGLSKYVDVQSTDIEVNEGDVIKFTFDYSTDVSQPGNGNAGSLFALRLFDGTDYRFARNFYINIPDPAVYMYPVWDILNSAPPALNNFWRHTIGTNTNEWETVVIETSPAPVSGILNCFLSFETPNNANETRYNSMRFEIIPSINQSTNMIGHIHNDSQQLYSSTKNNSDTEIYLDDSPRNSINGTTFLSSFTGLLQDRTKLWKRGTVTEQVRIGEIITFEKLFQRRKTRLKLEGNLLDLIQPGVFRYTGDADFGATDIISGLYVVHFPNIPSGYLLPGVTFTITGSTLNNGTYTAVAVSDNYPTGAVTVADTLTLETGGTATITIDDIPVHLSLLNVIKYAPQSSLNFIFGMLNIRFKESQADGTLYEWWQDGEVDSDLLQYYYFKYIYDTK